MSKSKTARIAALEVALRHIAQGVAGHCPVEETDPESGPFSLPDVLGLAGWFQYVAAVRVMFPVVDGYAGTYKLYNLHRFGESFSAGAEWLYEQGYQA